ncbi:hypothetical protein Lal_00012520 [Lupinus albus]|uniref:Putative aminoacyltransferase, E1 ubiquitin-activating enzyme n=1 Tax=Lupinus albus TaxID=3870 RepID=A0A6A4NNL8_LUPAL|nr:putative aminoacyltransferase, E1 ubiquitin-activating enzyme [Lupinus albus]KAF1883606.1 hypothetical protein Lal_00012520 [Lupinus albus]
MSNNNNLGSLLLRHHHHHSKSATTLRLCHSSFRRIIFDSITCGSISRRHNTTPPLSEEDDDSQDEKSVKPDTRLSEKLSDLLNMEETEAKEEALEELKKVVKELQKQEEDTRRRVAAAAMVRKVAKEDVEVRETLAMLGVIPPIVAMLDSEDVHSQIASLYALLNLGIGNDANKAAIVKVGAVQKMLKLIELPGGPNSLVSEAIVANFLGLSALDSNKPIIGSSTAISFLVRTLQSLDDKTSPQSKQDALRALYNISIFPGNVSCILETNLVHFLVNSIGDMELTERTLSILSNLVSTREGRKAISAVPDAFPILVDVLNWTDSPKCQENVSYILMVMAHKSYGDRQAMIEAGIASSLLELSLLGTTLAQKRASRILECLRVDKGKQVSGSFAGNLGGNVSAPIYGSLASCTKRDGEAAECLEEEEDMMSEEKKAVKQLVQQSLQNNMKKIVKRANLPQDIVPSDHFKSLTSSSTSKSLPF